MSGSLLHRPIYSCAGVKLADIMFSLLSVCLSVSLCTHGCWVFHTQYINANYSNMVKDTDYKFDKHVHRDSPDMTHRKIFEKGHGQDHVTP